MIRKNIVLFGAPGTGKGTYGRLLKEEFGIPVFSTGNYLRSITSQDVTKLNKRQRGVKAKIDSGRFIGDKSIVKIVKNAMSDFKDERTLLFDGFPRTLNQAQMLK